jgi:hypothetical protein
MAKYLALFSGASIGALLGLLVGLSSSPIVVTAIGIVSAIVATFLNAKTESNADVQQGKKDAEVRAISLIGLGIAGVLSIILGLSLRVRDAFSPSVLDRIHEWKNAQFSDDEAKRFVVFSQLGIVPEGFKVVARPNSTTPQNTILFAGNTELCDQLNPTNFQNATDIIHLYNAAGGNWTSFATVVQKLPPPSRREILVSGWELLCINR